MSKAKISPWPWKIYPTHNKIEIQDANAQPVAVVWSGEMRYGGHSKSRYMNARLLALAPKLLEECGNALRVLCRLNNPDVGCTCHTDGHYCAACTTRDLETIVACASEVPDVFTVDPWCHKETHDCRAIDPAGDPTLTPGEGEKPAAKPEAKPAITHRHGPIENVMVTAAEVQKPSDVSARTVHLRSDAHLSAVVDRVNGLADWVYALESRLAAEKADRPLWVNRYDAPTAEEIQAAVDLAKRLRAERDKPAARVVKAPGRINASEYAQTHWPISVIPYVENAIAFTHQRWREALASQGITITDEGSKT